MTGTSQRAMVHVIYRHTAAVALLIGSAAVAIHTLPTTLVRSVQETALSLGLIVVWLVAGIYLWRRQRWAATTAVVLWLLTLVSPVLTALTTPPGTPPLVAVLPAAVTTVVVVLLLDLRWSLTLTGIVLVTTFTPIIPVSGVGEAVWSTWPVVGFGLAVLGAKTGLRRAAERTDQQVHQHRTVELDLTRARAQENAHSAWQGLLHDEVAAALRATTTPGVERDEVRRSALTALEAIEDLATPAAGESVDLMPMIRQIADTADTAVGITGPGELVVPAPTAAAILGAVTEAMRNVERHAAGAPARIRASRDDEVVTIEISDDGPGFARPGRRRPGGLQVSVIDRMAHAGGAAHVHSTVGGGATVTLSWPTARVESAYDEPIRGVNRVLGVSAVPMLMAAGLFAWPQWWQGESPVGALWFAAMVVATALLVLLPAPASRRWLLWVALAIAAVGVIGLPAAGQTGGRMGAWPLLATTPVLLLFILRRPARYGLAAGAALLAGTLVVEGVNLPTITAEIVVAAMLALGASIAWAVRRFGAEVEVAAQAEQRQLEDAWRRSVREEVHARRRTRLEDMVVPFLRGLTDARTPIDETVRREAALLEQAVRDEMHLPEALDAQTRELIKQARASGCRVRLQSDAANGVPATKVCAIVQAALSVEPWPRELTLSVYVATEQATLAVVAVPGDPARREALERCCGPDVAVLEDGEDATWAEIRLHG
ncbi:MAG: hypothetical protein FWD18_10960 [Micrococcales bacterium]|nr:hypothetical protein [Micrococcales bacterium]